MRTISDIRIASVSYSIMGDNKDPSSRADEEQQRMNNDNPEQPSEKSSEKPSSMGALLNPNQASSPQSESKNKGSGSKAKKPKAIEGGNAQPTVDKNELQVQKRGTQAGGDTADAATSSDSKTQDNKPNDKGKNKQKEPEASPSLAHFKNTEGKLQDTVLLDFMTELERIEKCAETDYYGILGFPSDGNNVDPNIRAHRHMRLTQLMHPDKSKEELKKRATEATTSKRESQEMLDLADS